MVQQVKAPTTGAPQGGVAPAGNSQFGITPPQIIAANTHFQSPARSPLHVNPLKSPMPFFNPNSRVGGQGMSSPAKGIPSPMKDTMVGPAKEMRSPMKDAQLIASPAAPLLIRQSPPGLMGKSPLMASSSGLMGSSSGLMASSPGLLRPMGQGMPCTQSHPVLPLPSVAPQNRSPGVEHPLHSTHAPPPLHHSNTPQRVLSNERSGEPLLRTRSGDRMMGTIEEAVVGLPNASRKKRKSTKGRRSSGAKRRHSRSVDDGIRQLSTKRFTTPDPNGSRSRNPSDHRRGFEQQPMLQRGLIGSTNLTASAKNAGKHEFILDRSPSSLEDFPESPPFGAVFRDSSVASNRRSPTDVRASPKVNRKSNVSLQDLITGKGRASTASRTYVVPQVAKKIKAKNNVINRTSPNVKPSLKRGNTWIPTSHSRNSFSRHSVHHEPLAERQRLSVLVAKKNNVQTVSSEKGVRRQETSTMNGASTNAGLNNERSNHDFATYDGDDDDAVRFPNKGRIDEAEYDDQMQRVENDNDRIFLKNARETSQNEKNSRETVRCPNEAGEQIPNQFEPPGEKIEQDEEHGLKGSDRYVQDVERKNSVDSHKTPLISDTTEKPRNLEGLVPKDDWNFSKETIDHLETELQKLRDGLEGRSSAQDFEERVDSLSRSVERLSGREAKQSGRVENQATKDEMTGREVEPIGLCNTIKNLSASIASPTLTHSMSGTGLTDAQSMLSCIYEEKAAGGSITAGGDVTAGSSSSPASKQKERRRFSDEKKRRGSRDGVPRALERRYERRRSGSFQSQSSASPSLSPPAGQGRRSPQDPRGPKFGRSATAPYGQTFPRSWSTQWFDQPVERGPTYQREVAPQIPQRGLREQTISVKVIDGGRQSPIRAISQPPRQFGIRPLQFKSPTLNYRSPLLARRSPNMRQMNVVQADQLSKTIDGYSPASMQKTGASNAGAVYKAGPSHTTSVSYAKPNSYDELSSTLIGHNVLSAPSIAGVSTSLRVRPFSLLPKKPANFALVASKGHSTQSSGTPPAPESFRVPEVKPRFLSPGIRDLNLPLVKLPSVLRAARLRKQSDEPKKRTASEDVAQRALSKSDGSEGDPSMDEFSSANYVPIPVEEKRKFPERLYKSDIPIRRGSILQHEEEIRAVKEDKINNRRKRISERSVDVKTPSVVVNLCGETSGKGEASVEEGTLSGSLGGALSSNPPSPNYPDISPQNAKRRPPVDPDLLDRLRRHTASSKRLSTVTPRDRTPRSNKQEHTDVLIGAPIVYEDGRTSLMFGQRYDNDVDALQESPHSKTSISRSSIARVGKVPSVADVERKTRFGKHISVGRQFSAGSPARHSFVSHAHRSHQGTPEQRDRPPELYEVGGHPWLHPGKYSESHLGQSAISHISHKTENKFPLRTSPKYKKKGAMAHPKSAHGKANPKSARGKRVAHTKADHTGAHVKKVRAVHPKNPTSPIHHTNPVRRNHHNDLHAKNGVLNIKAGAGGSTAKKSSSGGVRPKQTGARHVSPAPPPYSDKSCDDEITGLMCPEGEASSVSLSGMNGISDPNWSPSDTSGRISNRSSRKPVVPRFSRPKSVASPCTKVGEDRASNGASNGPNASPSSGPFEFYHDDDNDSFLEKYEVAKERIRESKRGKLESMLERAKDSECGTSSDDDAVYPGSSRLAEDCTFISSRGFAQDSNPRIPTISFSEQSDLGSSKKVIDIDNALQDSDEDRSRDTGDILDRGLLHQAPGGHQASNGKVGKKSTPVFEPSYRDVLTNSKSRNGMLSPMQSRASGKRDSYQGSRRPSCQDSCQEPHEEESARICFYEESKTSNTTSKFDSKGSADNMISSDAISSPIQPVEDRKLFPSPLQIRNFFSAPVLHKNIPALGAIRGPSPVLSPIRLGNFDLRPGRHFRGRSSGLDEAASSAAPPYAGGPFRLASPMRNLRPLQLGELSHQENRAIENGKAPPALQNGNAPPALEHGGNNPGNAIRAIEDGQPTPRTPPHPPGEVHTQQTLPVRTPLPQSLPLNAGPPSEGPSNDRPSGTFYSSGIMGNAPPLSPLAKLFGLSVQAPQLMLSPNFHKTPAQLQSSLALLRSLDPPPYAFDSPVLRAQRSPVLHYPQGQSPQTTPHPQQTPQPSQLDQRTLDVLKNEPKTEQISAADLTKAVEHMKPTYNMDYRDPNDDEVRVADQQNQQQSATKIFQVVELKRTTLDMQVDGTRMPTYAVSPHKDAGQQIYQAISPNAIRNGSELPSPALNYRLPNGQYAYPGEVRNLQNYEIYQSYQNSLNKMEISENQRSVKRRNSAIQKGVKLSRKDLPMNAGLSEAEASGYRRSPTEDSCRGSPNASAAHHEAVVGMSAIHASGLHSGNVYPSTGNSTASKYPDISNTNFNNTIFDHNMNDADMMSIQLPKQKKMDVRGSREVDRKAVTDMLGFMAPSTPTDQPTGRLSSKELNPDGSFPGSFNPDASTPGEPTARPGDRTDNNTLLQTAVQDYQVRYPNGVPQDVADSQTSGLGDTSLRHENVSNAYSSLAKDVILDKAPSAAESAKQHGIPNNSPLLGLPIQSMGKSQFMPSVSRSGVIDPDGKAPGVTTLDRLMTAGRSDSSSAASQTSRERSIDAGSKQTNNQLLSAPSQGVDAVTTMDRLLSPTGLGDSDEDAEDAVPMLAGTKSQLLNTESTIPLTTLLSGAGGTTFYCEIGAAYGGSSYSNTVEKPHGFRESIQEHVIALTPGDSEMSKPPRQSLKEFIDELCDTEKASASPSASLGKRSEASPRAADDQSELLDQPPPEKTRASHFLTSFKQGGSPGARLRDASIEGSTRLQSVALADVGSRLEAPEFLSKSAEDPRRRESLTLLEVQRQELETVALQSAQAPNKRRSLTLLEAQRQELETLSQTVELQSTQNAPNKRQSLTLDNVAKPLEALEQLQFSASPERQQSLTPNNAAKRLEAGELQLTNAPDSKKVVQIPSSSAPPEATTSECPEMVESAKPNNPSSKSGTLTDDLFLSKSDVGKSDTTVKIFPYDSAPTQHYLKDVSIMSGELARVGIGRNGLNGSDISPKKVEVSLGSTNFRDSEVVQNTTESGVVQIINPVDSSALRAPRPTFKYAPKFRTLGSPAAKLVKDHKTGEMSYKVDIRNQSRDPRASSSPLAHVVHKGRQSVKHSRRSMGREKSMGQGRSMGREKSTVSQELPDSSPSSNTLSPSSKRHPSQSMKRNQSMKGSDERRAKALSQQKTEDWDAGSGLIAVESRKRVDANATQQDASIALERQVSREEPGGSESLPSIALDRSRAVEVGGKNSRTARMLIDPTVREELSSSERGSDSADELVRQILANAGALISGAPSTVPPSKSHSKGSKSPPQSHSKHRKRSSKQSGSRAASYHSSESRGKASLGNNRGKKRNASSGKGKSRSKSSGKSRRKSAKKSKSRSASRSPKKGDKNSTKTTMGLSLSTMPSTPLIGLGWKSLGFAGGHTPVLTQTNTPGVPILTTSEANTEISASAQGHSQKGAAAHHNPKKAGRTDLAKAGLREPSLLNWFFTKGGTAAEIDAIQGQQTVTSTKTISPRHATSVNRSSKSPRDASGKEAMEHPASGASFVIRASGTGIASIQTSVVAPIEASVGGAARVQPYSAHDGSDKGSPQSFTGKLSSEDAIHFSPTRGKALVLAEDTSPKKKRKKSAAKGASPSRASSRPSAMQGQVVITTGKEHMSKAAPIKTAPKSSAKSRSNKTSLNSSQKTDRTKSPRTPTDRVQRHSSRNADAATAPDGLKHKGTRSSHTKIGSDAGHTAPKTAVAVKRPANKPSRPLRYSLSQEPGSVFPGKSPTIDPDHPLRHSISMSNISPDLVKKGGVLPVKNRVSPKRLVSPKKSSVSLKKASGSPMKKSSSPKKRSGSPRFPRKPVASLKRSSRSAKKITSPGRKASGSSPGIGTSEKDHEFRYCDRIKASVYHSPVAFYRNPLPRSRLSSPMPQHSAELSSFRFKPARVQAKQQPAKNAKPTVKPRANSAKNLKRRGKSARRKSSGKPGKKASPRKKSSKSTSKSGKSRSASRGRSRSASHASKNSPKSVVRLGLSPPKNLLSPLKTIELIPFQRAKAFGPNSNLNGNKIRNLESFVNMAFNKNNKQFFAKLDNNMTGSPFSHSPKSPNFIQRANVEDEIAARAVLLSMTKRNGYGGDPITSKTFNVETDPVYRKLMADAKKKAIESTPKPLIKPAILTVGYRGQSFNTRFNKKGPLSPVQQPDFAEAKIDELLKAYGALRDYGATTTPQPVNASAATPQPATPTGARNLPQAAAGSEATVVPQTTAESGATPAQMAATNTSAHSQAAASTVNAAKADYSMAGLLARIGLGRFMGSVKTNTVETDADLAKEIKTDADWAQEIDKHKELNRDTPLELLRQCDSDILESSTQNNLESVTNIFGPAANLGSTVNLGSPLNLESGGREITTTSMMGIPRSNTGPSATSPGPGAGETPSPTKVREDEVPNRGTVSAPMTGVNSFASRGTKATVPPGADNFRSSTTPDHGLGRVRSGLSNRGVFSQSRRGVNSTSPPKSSMRGASIVCETSLIVGQADRGRNVDAVVEVERASFMSDDGDVSKCDVPDSTYEVFHSELIPPQRKTYSEKFCEVTEDFVPTAPHAGRGLSTKSSPIRFPERHGKRKAKSLSGKQKAVGKQQSADGKMQSVPAKRSTVSTTSTAYRGTTTTPSRKSMVTPKPFDFIPVSKSATPASKKKPGIRTPNVAVTAKGGETPGVTLTPGSTPRQTRKPSPVNVAERQSFQPRERDTAKARVPKLKDFPSKEEGVEGTPVKEGKVLSETPVKDSRPDKTSKANAAKKESAKKDPFTEPARASFAKAVQEITFPSEIDPSLDPSSSQATILKPGDEDVKSPLSSSPTRTPPYPKPAGKQDSAIGRSDSTGARQQSVGKTSPQQVGGPRLISKGPKDTNSTSGKGKTPQISDKFCPPTEKEPATGSNEPASEEDYLIVPGFTGAIAPHSAVRISDSSDDDDLPPSPKTIKAGLASAERNTTENTPSSSMEPNPTSEAEKTSAAEVQPISSNSMDQLSSLNAPRSQMDLLSQESAKQTDPEYNAVVNMTQPLPKLTHIDRPLNSPAARRGPNAGFLAMLNNIPNMK